MDKWILFNIKSNMGIEQYACEANRFIPTMFGFNLKCCEPSKFLNKNLLELEDDEEHLRWYAESLIEQFLNDCGYCEEWEAVSARFLFPEEVSLINQIRDRNASNADYSSFELSNDFCYHSKGLKTVNELIVEFANKCNN